MAPFLWPTVYVYRRSRFKAPDIVTALDRHRRRRSPQLELFHNRRPLSTCYADYMHGLKTNIIDIREQNESTKGLTVNQTEIKTA